MGGLVTRLAVSVAGTALPDDVLDSLVDLRTTKALGVPAYARLSFRAESTGTGLDAGRLTLKIGDAIKITVHETLDSASEWVAFDGLVVSQGLELDTGTSQYMVYECFDKLYKLGRTSVPETYVNMTASEVVQHVATAAGLSVGDIESITTNYEATYQYATGYAYLDRLARELGCEWFVDGDRLNFRPRLARAGRTRELTVGEDLRSFTARYSVVDHAKTVTVTGWDVNRKEPIVGTATFDSSTMKSSNDITRVTVPEGVRGNEALTIPRPVLDIAEAERLASGVLDRRGAEMLRARGEVVATDLVPGDQLELRGLAGGWSGTYYCTSVEHTFGSGGSMRTFFDVGPSDPESLVDIFESGTGSTLDRVLGSLTVGIVTNNNDEHGDLHRVKVQLPYFSEDEETNWARVLQPGAGGSRGWITLPEVGDEVLVGFEHGDIDRPFVLGGLHNGTDRAKHPLTDMVKDGKVQSRIFNSRLGHELRFADGSEPSEQFVQINTSADGGPKARLFLGAERIDLEAAGVPVKVFNDKGFIEIAANGDITLEGNNITIKAKQGVTIEAGSKLEATSKGTAKVESTGSLDLKSTAPATLQSSAVTNVKGTMVNIN